MDSSQKRDRDRKQRQRRQEKEERRKERAAQKLLRRTAPATQTDPLVDSPLGGAPAASIEGAPAPDAQKPI